MTPALQRTGPLPQPPPRPRTSRRHTTATMRLARTMYGDGDSWSPTQIAAYLADRGILVHPNTVRLWVIPSLAEQHRVRRRKPASKTSVLGRVCQLREAGLSYTAIAALLRLDLGLEVNADHVRADLAAGREIVSRAGVKG